MERVVNQLILQNQNLVRRVSSLEFITEVYHEWKKDTDTFGKYLRDKVEEVNKNRVGDSVPDNGQQEASKWVHRIDAWKLFRGQTRTR